MLKYLSLSLSLSLSQTDDDSIGVLKLNVITVSW